MLATKNSGPDAQSSAPANSKMNLVAAVAAIIALIAFLSMMGQHYLAPSTPPLSKTLGVDLSSFPSWVNVDAMQCQGNMYALPASEQKKIAAQFKDGGRTEIMASYALQTH